MNQLFASPVSRFFRVAYNEPVTQAPTSSPVAAPAGISSWLKGFMSQLNKVNPAGQAQWLEQRLNYLKNPQSKAQLLQELKNNPTVQGNPSLAPVLQKFDAATPPASAPAAEAPAPAAAPQPQSLDNTIPETPAVQSPQPTVNTIPAATEQGVYELAPGDSNERKPYDLAPADTKPSQDLNTPRPSQPSPWNASKQNAPTPQRMQQLQQARQQADQKLKYYTEFMRKIDNEMSGAANPSASATVPQTAPAAAAAPAAPASTEAPFTGNAQQNQGVGGWFGNALGRGLKAPGRMLRDIGRDVKRDVINPMQQGFQNFKQDFRNAGSETKILTASASSAYNRFAKS